MHAWLYDTPSQLALEKLGHGGLPCTSSLLDAVHLHDVLQRRSCINHRIVVRWVSERKGIQWWVVDPSAGHHIVGTGSTSLTPLDLVEFTRIRGSKILKLAHHVLHCNCKEMLQSSLCWMTCQWTQSDTSLYHLKSEQPLSVSQCTITGPAHQ